MGCAPKWTSGLLCQRIQRHQARNLTTQLQCYGHYLQPICDLQFRWRVSTQRSFFRGKQKSRSSKHGRGRKCQTGRCATHRIVAWGGRADQHNWLATDFGHTDYSFRENMVCKQQELEARFFEHTRCVWTSAFIETTKCLTNPPLCNTLPNSSHDSWDR